MISISEEKKWKNLSFLLIGMLAAIGVAGFFSDSLAPQVLAAPIKAAANVICNGCVGLNTDGTNDIADNAVTTEKLEPGAVSLLVTEHFNVGTVAGSPDGNTVSGSVTANCPSDHKPVGGGYSANSGLTIFSSSRSGGGSGNGWTVFAAHTFPTDQTFITMVECARILP